MSTRSGLVRGARRARFGATLAAGALLTTGCLSQIIPEPAPPPATYDLGPMPADTPPPLPRRFRLDGVAAPSWLASTNIWYRRLDLERAALRPYSRNVWIANVSELFEERLAYRLAQAAPANAASALQLGFELVSFEHVYAEEGNAHVVARARAAFEDESGRVQRRQFERRRPAAASVNGATTSMPLVADELIADVIDWLRVAVTADDE